MSVLEVDYDDQFFLAFLAGATTVDSDWSDEELWGFYLEWLVTDDA